MSLAQSYAISGQTPLHIKKIIYILLKEPQTAKQLEQGNLNVYHVADALENLSDMGLIRCEGNTYHLIK